jgi:septum formation protein
MLILASASPRRRELLTQAGFEFRVHPAHIPEDPLPNEDPIAYVTRLARQKAEAVYNEIAGGPGLASETWESGVIDQASLLVLGADTTVTLDNHILGKPENAEDAARMLRLLSGRTHRVITGVSLVSAASSAVRAEGAVTCAVSTAAEVTAVQFLSISEEEIQAYIATGEPADKAGAYAIQGRAARWIPRIEGCYFNVVGLPIALVSTLLDTQLDTLVDQLP